MYQSHWLLFIKTQPRPPIKYKPNTHLDTVTSFQQTGVLDHFYILDTPSDLDNFFKTHTYFNIIGKGSNSLFSRSGLATPTLQLGTDFQTLSKYNSTITAGAAVSVAQLLRFSSTHDLSGCEFMAGVPASVGGMVTMNFGCWDKEISHILTKVTVYIPGKGFCELSLSDCQFGYRKSIFQTQPWIITDASFSLTPSTQDSVKECIKSYVKQRLDKQPIRSKTFGSVFRNPPGYSAAALIEKAGLKGFQKNGIAISSHHANFFENIKNGTAEDVHSMISFVQETVLQLYNVKLIPEVVIFNAKTIS